MERKRNGDKEEKCVQGLCCFLLKKHTVTLLSYPSLLLYP